MEKENEKNKEYIKIEIEDDEDCENTEKIRKYHRDWSMKCIMYTVL